MGLGRGSAARSAGPALVLAFIVATLAVPLRGRAQADPASGSSSVAELIPPPPVGFHGREPLSPDDYLRKNERGYVTGLPLANFDPNTGFGGGVRGYYYFNGSRSDPLFAYTPYLHRLFLQFFFTTKGLQFHWLDYDAPAILHSPFRLRSQLVFARNTSQHFFGIGAATMGGLSYTGGPGPFDHFSDYHDQISAVRSDGTTLARYDHYTLTRPFALISVERTFFDGLIRPLVGVGITYVTIDDYTGELVDAQGPMGSVKAPMGPTRLSEACAAGAVVGCGGGWENFLRVGLSFDTRDFEPDPNRGLFVDVAADVGTTALGSDYTYARFLTAARFYASLLPRHADLVLAGRATFEVQSRKTPFFSMNVMPFTEDPRTGLGGLRSLRGFQQDRFVGRVLTLLNAELRWTFYRFALLRQKFALFLVPFVDTGRVYDQLGDLSLRNWRRGQGLAFRISWNLATVVTAEYGVSDEDTGIYINFNHMF
jgi:hypothetical protein